MKYLQNNNSFQNFKFSSAKAPSKLWTFHMLVNDIGIFSPRASKSTLLLGDKRVRHDYYLGYRGDA